PRLIRFVGDGSFVAVTENGQVLQGTPAGPTWTVKQLFNVNDSFAASFPAGRVPVASFRVLRADLSPDRKWVACAFQPNYLIVCPMNGGAARTVRVDFAVRSLAFDSNGRLAVAVTADNAQNDFRVESNDTIRLYDDPTAAEPKQSLEIKHRGRAEAMAWSPNGLLAIAGGDNHEVTLHDLKAPVKEAQGPLQVVRGKGRGLWEVRVGKDGETILFKANRDPRSTDPNRRGKGEWAAFNFATGKPVEAKDPVEIITESGGWKIVPSDGDAMAWFAVRNEAKVRLQLDRDRDEQPRCYCFLPAKPGEPTRVLIGH